MEYDGFMTTIQRNRTQKRTVLVFHQSVIVLLPPAWNMAAMSQKTRFNLTVTGCASVWLLKPGRRKSTALRFTIARWVEGLRQR